MLVESTLFQMPHCWKSHDAAQTCTFYKYVDLYIFNKDLNIQKEGKLAYQTKVHNILKQKRYVRFSRYCIF